MTEGLTARDVMSRDFIGVTEGDPIEDVIGVMVDEHAEGAIVVRGDEPVGYVTEHALLSFVLEEHSFEGVQIEDVMRPPPEPLDPTASLSAVLSRLSSHDGTQLPVVNGDRQLVGLVSESDVLAASASLLTSAGGDPVEMTTPPGDVTVQTDSQAGLSDRPEATQEEQFSSQGVCESCGSLTHDLVNANGQLLCPDCRTVA